MSDAVNGCVSFGGFALKVFGFSSLCVHAINPYAAGGSLFLSCKGSLEQWVSTGVKHTGLVPGIPAPCCSVVRPSTDNCPALERKQVYS